MDTQTYTVELKLIPRLESATYKRMQKYIIENPTGVEYSRPPEMSILGLIRVVVTDTNWEYDSEACEFRADFDGEISWEKQMHRMFEYIADTLAPGSSLEVWTNSGSWCLRVNQDGTIGQ